MKNVKTKLLSTLTAVITTVTLILPSGIFAQETEPAPIGDPGSFISYSDYYGEPFYGDGNAFQRRYMNPGTMMTASATSLGTLNFTTASGLSSHAWYPTVSVAPGRSVIFKNNENSFTFNLGESMTFGNQNGYNGMVSFAWTAGTGFMNANSTGLPLSLYYSNYMLREGSYYTDDYQEAGGIGPQLCSAQNTCGLSLTLYPKNDGSQSGTRQIGYYQVALKSNYSQTTNFLIKSFSIPPTLSGLDLTSDTTVKLVRDFDSTTSNYGYFSIYIYNALIKAEHWKYPVVEVCDYAFERMENINSIVFENGIIKLGDKLFGNIPSLKYIEIPSSVTSIGENAFEGVADQICICAPEGSYAYTYAQEHGIKLIQKHEHVLSDEVVVDVPVTCTQRSTTHRACTVEGCPYIDYEKGYVWLPHTPSGEWIEVAEATHTEYGKMVQYCTECNAEALVRWLPKTDHVPDGEWEITVQPTCTKYGEQVMKCSLCSKIIQKEQIDKAPHIPGEWKIIKKATEDEPGTQVKYCNICKAIVTEKEIPPLNWDNPFNDVSEDAWYYNAVKWANRFSVINGVTECTFVPDAFATRATIMQILYNYHGAPEVTSDQISALDTFTDLKGDAWYIKAVAWAYTENISSGTGETTFSPNDPITREQCATLIYNYFCRFSERMPNEQYNNGVSDFEDISQISSWAEIPMDWMIRNEFIVGTDDNLLAPKAQATRAEIVVIMANVFSER